jgi:sugar phosphate isomerase/epimerase
MQKLDVYQSLWAMELRSPHLPEPGKEETFRRIAAAGFDGVSLDPAVHEIDELRKLRPFFEQSELKCLVNAFPATSDELQPLLEFAAEFDAQLVNVISGVMPIEARDAVPCVKRWLDEADEMHLPLLFETHRNGLLNDLYFTLQLMDLVPEMRLCADLSHFVVDRELPCPVPAIEQGYIDRVLDRADCFQGRVANREQVQVPIGFPQHQDWVNIFKGWWRQGIDGWRRRSNDDDTLIFLCELGPPPYAITDAEQRELSDRFAEALTIREWVREIWQDLESIQTGEAH